MGSLRKSESDEGIGQAGQTGDERHEEETAGL